MNTSARLALVGLLVVAANTPAPAHAAARPDLVVTSISAPSSLNAGRVLTVTSTVKNRGAAKAAASKVRTWLSADTTAGNTGDKLLGTRYVTSLRAGASATGRTSYTLPAGIRKGAWNLIVCADATRLVRESVETNNCRVRAFVVNRPPAANNDTVTGTEDSPATIPTATLLTNDTDPDPVKTLAVTAVANGTGGVVSLSGTTITFTPDANRDTPATFTYVARDNLGLTDSAVVTVTLSPVNDAPVATDDVFSGVTEDTTVHLTNADLVGNDHDAEDESLSVTAVSDPVGGAVQLEAGGVAFTPSPNRTADSTFTYTLSDGNATDTANVTISWAPVNDAPVATDDQATTPYQAQLNIAATTLSANDTDVDLDSLTVTAVSNALNGTVLLSSGTVTFTPTAGFSGTAGFDYTISDGQLTETGHVTVTVGEPNIIVTSVSSQTLGESGNATVGVTLGTQPAANVTVTVASSDTTAFTVSPATLTFTPNNWNVQQIVTLTGVADIDLVNESGTLNLTSPATTNKQVSVSVTDDDTQAFVVSPPAPLTVNEGSSGSVSVHLAFQPTSNVTVTVSSSDTSTATVSTSVLTFTPANFAVDQSVTINGVADVDLTDDNATVTFSAPGGVLLGYAVTVHDLGP